MRDIGNGRDIDGHIGQLQRQLDALFYTLQYFNEHYWAAVVEPEAI